MTGPAAFVFSGEFDLTVDNTGSAGRSPYFFALAQQGGFTKPVVPVLL